MLTLKEIDKQKADRDQMVYQMQAIEDGGKQPIKKVREVLDEESFVEGLEKIITRDYYPDLWKIQEYKRWKEESHKTGVGISDLLSKVSEQESVKRAVFEKDLEKMTLSQYITKYTSEDNNSLEKMMERDRERYLEKHSWMFKPYLSAQENNKQLQIESDNKLRNMVEGMNTASLQFVASDPMSKFIFSPSRPAIESYSDPFSYHQKQIIKENTRLPEFMRPNTRQPSGNQGSALLGIRRETSPTSKTPFNLREMLGEEEENPDDQETSNSGGFKPLRFPSPSPSMLDSPLMTWGDIETEPQKLGPISQREAYQENPRERLAHELSSKLLEKTKLRNKKKEAQLQKILTPYAKHLTDQRNSALISHISSKLMTNKNSSLYKSYFNTPKPAPGKLNDQK